MDEVFAGLLKLKEEYEATSNLKLIDTEKILESERELQNVFDQQKLVQEQFQINVSQRIKNEADLLQENSLADFYSLELDQQHSLYSKLKEDLSELEKEEDGRW